MPAAASEAQAVPRNTLGIEIAQLVAPISQASVRFVTPSANERVALGDARRYEVHWSSEQLDPDALGIDVALDAERPRRVPAAQSALPLGELLPAGEELTAGVHWLFAAPISASGLVPRRAEGAPASAVAVRFQLGAAGPGSVAPGGAVWLRKPEGTYNGPSAEHVLFDGHSFAKNGTPLAAPCKILVRGKSSGELAFPGPVSALALAGGDYEISASAPGAGSAAARFITVNPELGGPK